MPFAPALGFAPLPGAVVATLAGLVDKAWELGGTASPEGVVVLHIVG